MMVFHILDLLAGALLGGWEYVQWAIASSICDSLLSVLRNA